MSGEGRIQEGTQVGAGNLGEIKEEYPVETCSGQSGIGF